MTNRTMLIALAIDEILVSSTAALQTLGILQQLGFKSISIDPTNNMMMRD